MGGLWCCLVNVECCSLRHFLYVLCIASYGHVCTDIMHFVAQLQSQEIKMFSACWVDATCQCVQLLSSCAVLITDREHALSLTQLRIQSLNTDHHRC